MNQQVTMNPPSSASCPTSCQPDRSQGTAAKPEYRVEPRAEGVSIHLALPGVAKEAVGVSVKDGLLTVTAERQAHVADDWTAHREWNHPRRYRLDVRLHPDLDPDSIKAALANGVLKLDIERRESAKPRSIEIN